MRIMSELFVFLFICSYCHIDKTTVVHDFKWNMFKFLIHYVRDVSIFIFKLHLFLVKLDTWLPFDEVKTIMQLYSNTWIMIFRFLFPFNSSFNNSNKYMREKKYVIVFFSHSHKYVHPNSIQLWKKMKKKSNVLNMFLFILEIIYSFYGLYLSQMCDDFKINLRIFTWDVGGLKKIWIWN